MLYASWRQGTTVKLELQSQGTWPMDVCDVLPTSVDDRFELHEAHASTLRNSHMEAIMQTCAPRLSEEERLIARCLQGEDIAWDTMFTLYHPRLVSIISFIECGCDK